MFKTFLIGYVVFLKAAVGQEPFAANLSLSLPQALELADRVWYHESNHEVERLDLMTFWNEKEPFPSIGIAHFIWPPASYQGPFSSGRFHLVVEFIKQRGFLVPEWLSKARYCPWETREEFYAAINSEKMQELKDFLQKTKDLQALYLVERLKIFHQDLLALQDSRAISFFNKMLELPQGLYVLIDYLNFKHDGMNPQERYKGEGWGLLQVLQNIDEEEAKESLGDAFANSAKKRLQLRAENAPNPEETKAWFPNWFRRLDSYR